MLRLEATFDELVLTQFVGYQLTMNDSIRPLEKVSHECAVENDLGINALLHFIKHFLDLLSI